MRKSIAATLVTTAVLLFTGGAVRAGNGDVDASGAVNAADVILALRYAGGKATPTAGQASAGDTVVGAGVNLLDVVRIARIASGLDPFVPGSGSAALPRTDVVTVASSGTTTRDFSLAGGFRVTGTVNLTNPDAFGYVTLRNTSNQATYGPVLVSSFLSKAYSFTVPAGTYQLYYAGVEDDQTFEGSAVTRVSPVTVLPAFTVSANVSGKDFAPPAAPASSDVSVAFAGDGLAAFNVDSVEFSDEPLTGGFLLPGYGRYASVEPLPLGPDKYPLAAGTYRTAINGQQLTALGIFVDFSYYISTTFTAPTATTRTFTVPSVRELQGTLADPVGGGGQPTYVDIVSQSLAANIASSSYPTAFPYNYTLVAPPGSYYLNIEVTLTGGSDTIEFVVPATIAATGTSVKNVSLPALPAFKTLTGTVRGPDGKALAGADVFATLPYPTTIPAGGKYIYSGAATTDSAGKYTMLLPADTYEVTVTPP